MIPVKISVLKAKLSYYLGQVKQGQEVVVMDRNTPVATIAPSRPARERLAVTPAKKSPQALKKIKPVKLKGAVDVVALLREERDER